MKSIAIIDGSSVGYASLFGGAPLTSKTLGHQTQAVYNMTRTIARILKAHPNWYPVIVWDGKAQWRFDLFPDYKGSRSNTPEKIANKESFNIQKPWIVKIMRDLGVMQIKCETSEADDLAFQLVKKLHQSGTPVSLVTGDTDWWQMLQEGMTWEDHRKGQEVTLANFEESSGYKTPAQYIDGKCIVGDTSDEIPGITKLGPKTAVKLLQEFGTVSAFFDKVATGFEPKQAVYKALASPEGLEIWNRNRKLMDLSQAPYISGPEVRIKKGQPSQERLLNCFKELEFNSFIHGIDEVEAPFHRAIDEALEEYLISEIQSL